MWCLCAVFVVVRNSWGGGGKGKEPVSITRSVAGQEIVESQDPSSMGRENKGNEKWGRDSEWEGFFQERGKKKSNVFNGREKRGRNSGIWWCVGFWPKLISSIFFSVILMGLHTWLPAYVLGMADVIVLCLCTRVGIRFSVCGDFKWFFLGE